MKKDKCFFNWLLLGGKFLHMKLARTSQLYSSSHDACKVFDNIVKIVGRH
jgi:hypothetical protein